MRGFQEQKTTERLGLEEVADIKEQSMTWTSRRHCKEIESGFWVCILSTPCSAIFVKSALLIRIERSSPEGTSLRPLTMMHRSMCSSEHERGERGDQSISARVALELSLSCKWRSSIKCLRDGADIARRAIAGRELWYLLYSSASSFVLSTPKV